MAALHPTRHDPEVRALTALAEVLRALPPHRRPEDSLQVVVDLARSETRGKYAALNVTDEHDRTQGFVTSGMTAEQLRGLRVPPSSHGPLSSLRADGKPVRMDNVNEHRRAFGFPPRHPSMRSLLGVPLWANGVVRGALYVTDREDGQPFDEDDERLVLTLARHASTVIEREWY